MTKKELFQALRLALQQATSPADVHNIVRTLETGAGKNQMRDVWLTVAAYTPVFDPAIIRSIFRFNLVGALVQNRALQGPAARLVADGLVRAMLARAEGKICSAALSLGYLAAIGTFTSASCPDAARIVKAIVLGQPLGELPVPFAGFDFGEPLPSRNHFLSAVYVAANLADADDVDLADLDGYFDDSHDEFRELIAKSPRADCRVWAASLARPTEILLFAIGHEIRARSVGSRGRSLRRRGFSGRVHYRAGCKCDIIRRAEDLAMKSYPRTLAPYCRMAKGARFRALFARFAQVSPGDAAEVFGMARSGQLSHLQAGDVGPLLALADPKVRTTVLTRLGEIGS